MDTPATTLERPRASSMQRSSRFGGAVRWAALLCVAAVALVAAARFGWLPAGWGQAADQRSLYRVQPVNLSITLTESGEIKPRESINIKCEIEGQATIVKVIPESTRVKKGDLLVELASDALTERLEQEQIELQGVQSRRQRAVEELEIQRDLSVSDTAKAQIDLEIAQLDLEKYLDGDFEQKRASNNIDIQQAELDLDRKKEELDKNKDLLERGFVTSAKIKQLVFEVTKAEMTLNRANLAQTTLLEYEVRMERMRRDSTLQRAIEELDRVKRQADSRVKQAEADVQQLESTLAMREGRVRRLQEQLAKCKIYAPADGIIQYQTDQWGRDETRIADGAKVYEGQTLLVLPDTTRMLVSTRIHEGDRHRVSEGTACVVRVPAVPGKTFIGRVSKIAKFADSANRWINPELKEHATEILLDETDAPLSPGDSAEIELLIETVQNVLAVPVQAVHARGRRSFLFVQSGVSTDPVEVTLGRSTTTAVEVLNGIQTGDRILLHADERMIAELPAIQSERSAPLGEPAVDAQPESARANPKPPGADRVASGEKPAEPANEKPAERTTGGESGQ